MDPNDLLAYLMHEPICECNYCEAVINAMVEAGDRAQARLEENHESL